MATGAATRLRRMNQACPRSVERVFPRHVHSGIAFGIGKMLNPRRATVIAIGNDSLACAWACRGRPIKQPFAQSIESQRRGVIDAAGPRAVEIVQ